MDYCITETIRILFEKLMNVCFLSKLKLDQILDQFQKKTPIL